MRVALIGTGRMGAAMAGRLRGAGVDLVVHNRSLPKAEKVAAETGATIAGTAREAASAAAVVLVSLADDEACTTTYAGVDGIAAGAGSDTVVVETSTIDPRTVDRLGALLDERGAGLLDAPVSGSVPLVERGELTVMAGGAAADLERVRPVLDLLARKVFHVGGRGAGSTMKLAVNGIVHALNQAVAEALVLAENAGIDRAVAYEVFANSAVAAPFVLYKRAAFEHPGEAPVAFSLELVAKDYALILGLAHRLGVAAELSEAGRRTVAAALDAGLGERDMSALADYLRQ
ncbi:MAG TPA: NAD(P)-dependent oxidoreductase [Kribbella sp.]|nr:NAD(P)-dependent oxidoreductase [Kribbella sp.]